MTDTEINQNAAVLYQRGFITAPNNRGDLQKLVTETIYLIRGGNCEADKLKCSDEAELVINTVNQNNSGNAQVTHLSLNTYNNNIMLSFVRDADIASKPLNNPAGVTAFVYNLTNPAFSELCKIYFNAVNGTYCRYK